MIKKATFFLMGLLVSHTTIQAQEWEQIGSDIDGEAAYDYSGVSVSLSSDGSIVAIGAHRNDGSADNAGHGRIYKYQSGDWAQIGNDIDGEAAGDHFGRSIRLNSDGSIVAIGAHENDENGNNAGHVRIYENISGTWTQIGNDIDGEAAGDRSGASISLNSDGTIIAIGAHKNDESGTDAGHVRVFENQSGTWTQIGNDIDGVYPGENFGYSVSLSSDGSILAIGALYTDGNDNAAGHVRIYENQSGTWTQIGNDIVGESQNDQFGRSVSLSSDGSIVAIGAPYNDESGIDAGHVRVFENQSGTWTQLGNDIDGEAAGDKSGYSASLNSDGSVLAIGAYENEGNGNDAGHVRLYQYQSDTWTQLGEDIDSEASGDKCGRSVSISSDGARVALGSFYNSDSTHNAGHVRVFKSSTLDIENLQQHGISIYPNPTNGTIKIEFSNNSGWLKAGDIQKLIISDITGKQIIEKTEIQQNETFNLSGVESGLYILSIQTNEGIFSTKIIKD
jgi:hypothetical protein